MIENCCTFTGHRPHKFPWRNNETDSRCVALKALLSGQITALVNAGFTQFLSGMAEAADYEKGKIMRSEILEAVSESSR